VILWYPYS